jgi:predicted metal-dependent enzyme (double-stranded beta helix superfamily)
MKENDWLVTGDGKHQACESKRTWDLLKDNYRLYRFLTEVEDVLKGVENECDRLPEIRMLVRRLVANSYWVHTQYLKPCPQTGTSVLLLYDELGFPLTVQTVSLSPGTVSNIHNHGTWGVVAVLAGQEKNRFWRRTSTSQYQGNIEPTGEVILSPGDIISFTPDAIHTVQAVGDEPTITLNIYGETDPKERFEFDPVHYSTKHF